MDVHAFIRTRPCLEGIEGYLNGLRMQIDHPEILHGNPPQYATIDGEVLKPIEEYRQKLLSGKEVPAPTRLEQEWTYALRKRPERKRRTPENDDLLIEVDERPRKILDLNARKKK